MAEELKPAMPGFKFRFSGRNPRDVQLSHWIREDTDTEQVNVSEVCKQLLYAWYQQRFNGDGLLWPGGNGAGAMPAPRLPEGREDPDDPLVQNLVGLTFDERM